MADGGAATGSRVTLLLQKVCCVLWALDAATLRPTYVNERATELFGHPLDQWLDATGFWLACVAPEDRAALISVVKQVAVDGKTREHEHRALSADGRTLWFRTEVHSLESAEMPPKTLGGMMFEVTERKHLEEVLRNQQEEERIILDSVPAMIWFKDANNRILRANRLAAETQGLTPAEMPGRRTEEFYPDEAHLYLADDLEVIRSGKPKRGIVEPHQLPSGEKIWVRTDKIPYRDENGEITGVIVFAVDITSTVRAEEERGRLLDQEQAARAAAEHALSQLEEAQRELVRRERFAALGELAAVVAHEVRNPLGAIFNSLGSLRKRIGTDGEAGLLLRILEEEAGRLNRIVVDLLNFVRPLRPTLRRESLGGVIDEALAATVRALPNSEIHVTSSIDPAVPPVTVDPQLLHIALVNVLSNAFQAMPEGGRLQVALQSEQRGGQPYARISIRDTGPGIPVELLSRVFEPFFTTRALGTGVGLAVVKRILDSHGGEVEVQSEPGEGSTFVFHLPYDAPDWHGVADSPRTH